MMLLETSSPRFSAFGEVGVAAGKGLPAWRTPNIKLGTRLDWDKDALGNDESGGNTNRIANGIGFKRREARKRAHAP